jgi:hypothetical protein
VHCQPAGVLRTREETRMLSFGAGCRALLSSRDSQAVRPANCVQGTIYVAQ